MTEVKQQLYDDGVRIQFHDQPKLTATKRIDSGLIKFKQIAPSACRHAAQARWL
jgi:hypothetical protein